MYEGCSGITNSKIFYENVMVATGINAGSGRGMWVVAQGFLVRICKPGSRIEVAPSLAASCYQVTSPRALESRVLN